VDVAPGRPARLEAFDSEGKVVDLASPESIPGRKAPGDKTLFRAQSKHRATTATND